MIGKYNHPIPSTQVLILDWPWPWPNSVSLEIMPWIIEASESLKLPFKSPSSQQSMAFCSRLNVEWVWLEFQQRHSIHSFSNSFFNIDSGIIHNYSIFCWIFFDCFLICFFVHNKSLSISLSFLSLYLNVHWLVVVIFDWLFFSFVFYFYLFWS